MGDGGQKGDQIRIYPCASEWLSMAGAMMVPLVLAAEVAAAMHLDSSRTVVVVATDMDVMRVMAFETTHSLTMPFPGSPGLYVSWRVRWILVINMVTLHGCTGHQHWLEA